MSAGDVRRRAMVFNFDTRVLDDKQEIIWREPSQRMAIPGNPVGIRLTGSNIVVSIQFTPFIRREGNVLVAQGQIWINDPERGVSYHTSIQTIPMEFNEPIYFFPLGASSQQISSTIEIIITVNPYSETGALTGNDR